MKSFSNIEFTNEDLKSLILNEVLADYSENGGNELSLVCITSDGKISYETSFLLKQYDVSSILKTMRKNGVQSFELTFESGVLIGLSEHSNQWVVATGDNINYLKTILNNLWHSTFEYL